MFWKTKGGDTTRSTSIICLKSPIASDISLKSFSFTYHSLSLSLSPFVPLDRESEMTWSVFRSINSPTLDLSAALRSTRSPLFAAGAGCATLAGVSLFRMSSRSPPFASLSVSASASGISLSLFSSLRFGFKVSNSWWHLLKF